MQDIVYKLVPGLQEGKYHISFCVMLQPSHKLSNKPIYLNNAAFIIP